jgi:dUTP pyrophosphatase
MYQTKQSAGFDLESAEYALLQPGESELIDTGIKLHDVLPNGIPGTAFAMVCPRSGLAATFGVTVLNSPGIVDLDYLNTIKVCLINHGKDPFIIYPGTRIAQLVFSAAYRRTELVKDEERTGGHGSTGV